MYDYPLGVLQQIEDPRFFVNSYHAIYNDDTNMYIYILMQPPRTPPPP